MSVVPYRRRFTLFADQSGRLKGPVLSLAGVPRFIFVSVHDYNLPSFAKDGIGYFVGKQKAEKRIMELYPTSGGLP
jgi:hypothetical protein